MRLMTPDELAIKALLDRYCIWNANSSLVERVQFALERLNEYTDELVNTKRIYRAFYMHIKELHNADFEVCKDAECMKAYAVERKQ